MSIKAYALDQGIGLRAARKRVESKGLKVRSVKSLLGGGRSGISYEVLIEGALNSLSIPDLMPVNQPQRHNSNAPATNAPMAQLWRDFIRFVIAPALAHPANSRARGKVIRELSQREWQTPISKIAGISVKTIRNWIKKDEANLDLARRKRSDAGQRKVIISRGIDEAVKTILETHDAARKAKLADGVLLTMYDDLALYAKSLSAQLNHQPKTLLPRANQKLCQLLEAQGIPAPKKSFQVPMRHIQRWIRSVSDIRDRNFDIKAFHNKRYRSVATTLGMRFNELVQVDATKGDAYRLRADGSMVTPYMITFVDRYSRLAFSKVYIFEKGKALRNEHVIEALIEYVERYGLPGSFMLDNGSEFNCLSLLEPGLRALAQSLPDVGLGENFIIHNRAYNSQGKGTVERVQGIINHQMSRTMQGWLGGDRMHVKTANHGHLPAPYEHSEEQMIAEIQQKIAEYNNLPSRGDHDTASPNQRLQKSIDDGFQKTEVKPEVWIKVFSEEKVLPIRQGKITHGGMKWYCQALAITKPHGKALVRVPLFWKWNALLVYDNETKEYIGQATPHIGHHPLDQDAAKLTAKIKSEYERNVRLTGRGLIPANQIDDHLELSPEPLAPIGAILGLADHEAKRLPSRIETEHDRYLRENQKTEEAQDRMQETEREIRMFKEQNSSRSRGQK